jgi:thiol:disulfide interchange protein
MHLDGTFWGFIFFNSRAVDRFDEPALRTLDVYAQERWMTKLQTIVPYVLLATPVILLIVLVAMRMGGIRSPEHIMLAAALVLVIQATLTVSLTAEGSDALSASMGILGAIAGYLFGRARQDTPATPSTTGKETPHAAREGLDVIDRRAA